MTNPFVQVFFDMLLAFSVVLILGIFILVARRIKKWINQPLEDVAQELGFEYRRHTFIESRYEGVYRGRKMAFYLYLPKHELMPSRVTRIVAWHKGELHKDLFIRKPGMINVGIECMAGLSKDIPLHNPQFDNKLKVYGEEVEARRLIDASVQDKILGLEPQLITDWGLMHSITLYKKEVLEIYLNSFLASPGGLPVDKESLKKAVELACDLAERIEMRA